MPGTKRQPQLKNATPTLPTKLASWIDHRLNVLFRGRLGVGKTEIVQAAFERAGLRWRRFSSQRFEVDEIFEDATVEALFFDDLERLPKKVRSVVLDLVRGGSEWLSALKVVWAAVSVAEDDVDEFDLASVEPFDVTVDVPVRPHCLTSPKSSVLRSLRRLPIGGISCPKRCGGRCRRGRWRRR